MSQEQGAIGKTWKSRVGLMGSSSVALMLSVGAHAQTPTSATPAAPVAAITSDPNGQFGDIVVYANKKSVGQLAQSVPAGITAVSCRSQGCAASRTPSGPIRPG